VDSLVSLPTVSHWGKKVESRKIKAESERILIVMLAL